MDRKRERGKGREDAVLYEKAFVMKKEDESLIDVEYVESLSLGSREFCVN